MLLREKPSLEIQPRSLIETSMPYQLKHDWFTRPLPENVRLADNCWIYSSFAFLHYRSNQPIGVSVDENSGVYHGTFFDLGPTGTVEIGKYCSLVGVIIATNHRVAIGDYSFIAHEVVIADEACQIPAKFFANESQNDSRLRREIVIGQNVWIGAQVAIVGSVQIGEGAIIGAGTVVSGDVPPYTLCAGNPMRKIREINRPIGQIGTG
jgi:acetyltransferase-like isoleucine patch superfamily enzyme